MLRDSEPIRLLETLRSLNECILILSTIFEFVLVGTLQLLAVEVKTRHLWQQRRHLEGVCRRCQLIVRAV